MDKISKEARSRNMASIKSKNTKPELLVRKYLFSQGLRYRIHSRLPGKPDITFPSKQIAVFIHGCFWHGHGCKLDHIPKSNNVFWQEKITKNKQRDERVSGELHNLGWITYVIWCIITRPFRE
jgi:DNA mismatch endonuclease (patch repair protein)